MSSKGIEPFTAINQFFYREPPLPIGSPTLSFEAHFKQKVCNLINQECIKNLNCLISAFFFN